MNIENHILMSAGHGAKQDRPNDKVIASNTAAMDLQGKFDRLMAKSKPSKREQTKKIFRDLYPALREHIAHGKPLKEVLTAFNTLNRSSLCLRTFNDMLAKEHERLIKKGDASGSNANGHSAEAHTDNSYSANSNTSESSVLSLNTVEKA